jgi:hypothetical protein
MLGPRSDAQRQAINLKRGEVPAISLRCESRRRAERFGLRDVSLALLEGWLRVVEGAGRRAGFGFRFGVFSFRGWSCLCKPFLPKLPLTLLLRGGSGISLP